MRHVPAAQLTGVLWQLVAQAVVVVPSWQAPGLSLPPVPAVEPAVEPAGGVVLPVEPPVFAALPPVPAALVVPAAPPLPDADSGARSSAA
ncbi:hypothetical protein [Sorangium sp. So ce388]|uniref:hypothetical protein n=1 Tax=Sorangium sp. So ce388 TaxID=3133309 RepID=UPI003F5C024E